MMVEVEKKHINKHTYTYNVAYEYPQHMNNNNNDIIIIIIIIIF